jgi:hypothetical protein
MARWNRIRPGSLATAVGAVFVLGSAVPVSAGSPVADTVVTNTNDAGPGSLRQAVLNANAQFGPGFISFAISSGPQTISLHSPLPPITDPVTISGFSQPGSDGRPIIELDGSGAGGGPGLNLAVGQTKVDGLVINGFSGDGIYAAVGFNGIIGNYIGTDISGTLARPNLGNGIVLAGNYASTVGGSGIARNVISGNLDKGIVIVGQSNFNLGAGYNFVTGNYIGVDATGSRALGNRFWGVMVDSSTDNLIGPGNILSSNGLNGVAIVGASSRFNSVIGNLIGTDAGGTQALGNGQDGVLIADASHNKVGGTETRLRNVISANGLGGIDLVGGPTTTANTIAGNYIGTDITGTHALPNSFSGVKIDNVPGNTVGGGDPGAGNLISGNLEAGVLIGGASGTANMVQGNLLGTDASGTGALGNALWGVALNGAPGNIIGGTTSGARNIVSGNDSAGILLAGPGSSDVVVRGNYVGLDASGAHPLPNGDNGIVLDRAVRAMIGGTAPGDGNVVSSNPGFGIAIFGGDGSNSVQGNLLGTDASGSAALGNGFGVFVINSPNNVIGGTTAGAGNVMSGNTANGINILGAQTSHTIVQGNLIGTDRSGHRALGNSGHGVVIGDSSDNVIGGTSAASRNVISGNGAGGVTIVDATSTRNVVAGNYIGTDITGSNALGNGLGIVIGDAPGNVVGGIDPGSGNVVSGNHGHGVLIYGTHGTHNLVRGNLVGTDSSGRAALGNDTWGVVLDGAPGNIVGGTSPAARNVLSGNAFDGMLITGPGATGNYVQGNFIGTDLTGNVGVGNRFNGIILDANQNTIGGTDAGAGNLIAFNPTVGVVVRSGIGNTVRGNSIFSNGALGIDLGDFGVTANDRGDVDTGPNNLQNFPVITRVVGTPVELVIVGSVDTPNPSSVVIDIYTNKVADPSGYGQGQMLIGSAKPNTGGRFTVILAPQPKGTVISATATDAQGNTSEFSLDAIVGP